MGYCDPCDLFGGRAQCARYTGPDGPVWEAHQVECPTQNRWVGEAVSASFATVAVPVGIKEAKE